jgi:hypothetical protein
MQPVSYRPHQCYPDGFRQISATTMSDGDFDHKETNSVAVGELGLDTNAHRDE